ncbi:hypothetical protein [Paraburkholderia jirisanensis]
MKMNIMALLSLSLNAMREIPAMTIAQKVAPAAAAPPTTRYVWEAGYRRRQFISLSRHVARHRSLPAFRARAKQGNVMRRSARCNLQLPTEAISQMIIAMRYARPSVNAPARTMLISAPFTLSAAGSQYTNHANSSGINIRVDLSQYKNFHKTFPWLFVRKLKM